MNYFFLFLGWIVYFVLHSVFALQSIKNRFNSLGLKAQTYRLIYTTLAGLLLVPIILISSTIPSEYIFSPVNLSKLIGLFLASWGIVIAKVAFKSYDIKAFLGLDSLQPENEFKTDGLLKYVRHPLYSGSILLILGYVVFNSKITTCISAILLIIYFLIGIQFEERKLIKLFGEKYLEYKSKTPMLIPRIWTKKIPS